MLVITKIRRLLFGGKIKLGRLMYGSIIQTVKIFLSEIWLLLFAKDFSNPNKTLETDNKSLVCDVRPKEFNGNNMPSYECFYDEELRQMVAEKFKNDIKYFNYKFED